MLEGRRLPAAFLALLLGASPAFAITGDVMGGEPVPERTAARPEGAGAGGSVLGSPSGYVGYASQSTELPASTLPLAEAAPAQADAAAAPAAQPAAVTALDESGSVAEHELPRHTIIMTDGEPRPNEDGAPSLVRRTMREIRDFGLDEINRLADLDQALLRSRRLAESYPERQMFGSWYGEERMLRSRYPAGYNRPNPGYSQIPLVLEGGETRSRNITWPHPAPLSAQSLPAPDTLTPDLPFGERQPEAPVPGAERLKAIRVAFRADRDRLMAFWKRRTGVLVKAAGDEFPLTFSLDTELGIADAFRTIIANDDERARLDAWYGGPAPKDRLAQAAGLSLKQFEPFALRPGVERGRGAYNLSDLRPDVYARVAGYMDRPNDAAMKSMAGRAAAALGLPVVASLDSLQKTAPLVANHESWDIELSHKSWEEIPSLFAALIRRLHEALAAPQTHLHIGLPSANGKDANVAVARAMETLMILDLASSAPSSLANQSFDATVLVHGVYERSGDNRGLVNFTYVEWTTPHETDNLELRYYPDIETGLRWLAMAAELARNHKRLRVYPEFDVKDKVRYAAPDALTVNLAGALKYASLLLGDSGEADDRRVAADLRLLSRRVEDFLASSDAQHMGLPMELREQIAEHLRSHAVKERMTTNAFLMPKASGRRAS